MPRPRSDAKPPRSRWSAAKRTEALTLYGVSGDARAVAREIGVPWRTVLNWITAADPEEIERYRREASDVIGELALATSRRALEIAATSLEREGATLGPVDAAKCVRDLTQSFGKLADARQIRERVRAEVDREIDVLMVALRNGLPERELLVVCDIIEHWKQATGRDPNEPEPPDDTPLPLPESWERH